MTQEQALNILKTGANVFLTGEPGSGKTHTVNQYVTYLREHGIEPAITASTGIAATHIHGQTLHSWSGIGVRKTLNRYDLDHIATTEYLSRRINKTKVLIIDEISMIDAGTLDMVDMVCREVRQVPEAFGGMQIVLVGDFFQLPPITKQGERARFAFQSSAWASAKPLVCYLSEQHRQEDQKFLSILSAIRTNTYDEMHNDYLESRLVQFDDAIPENVLTRLFSHNADVDAINNAELAKLPGTAMRYGMQGKGSDALVAALKKGCLSPETLELKIGAAVMCTKNNASKGYVNGTLGTVVGFESGTKYPIIETRNGDRIMIEPADWNIEESGKIKARISQIPLRLAWAITIHKSQGMSLDAALMDLREVFEYGQGYVALSRVRALSGLHLLGWNPQTFMVHPLILEEDAAFKSQSYQAQGAFEQISKDDLVLMQHNFILASGGTVARAAPRGKKDTLEETRALVLDGLSLNDIAKKRNLVFATVASHIEKLVDSGKLSWQQIEYLFTPEILRSVPDIAKAFKKCKTDLLAPVREHLKNKYSFDTIRLARIVISAKK
jgi:ATP-dependent DNA helicase PIF1